MKKLLTLALTAMISVSLSACNNTDKAPESLPTATSNVKPLPPVTAPPKIDPLPPVTETPSITPLTTPSSTPSKKVTEAPPGVAPTPPNSFTAPPTPSATPVKKTVALTFDDGPTPYSLQVLAILKEKQVPATFFEVGKQVKQNPEITRKLSEAGMSVQSHSWRHADLKTLSTSGLAADLADTSAAITNVTGKPVTCVRPPYGSTNKRVKNAIKASGATQLLWNVDSEDWKDKGSNVTFSHTLATLQPESVILMHDGVDHREQTVAVLPKLIDALKAKGYTFTFACTP